MDTHTRTLTGRPNHEDIVLVSHYSTHLSIAIVLCLEHLMVASTMIKNVRTLTHDDRFVVLLLGLVHALILGLLQLIHLAGVLPHHLGGEGD